MAKSLKPRITTIVGCAAITAAVGITLGLPQTTHAEKNELAMWVAPGTQVAPNVVAEGRLVRDSKSKSGWALEIQARNSGDQLRHCTMTAAVFERGGSPMARVSPPPTMVWRQKETFSVGPHATLTQRIPVSQELAQRLNVDAPLPPPEFVETGTKGKGKEKDEDGGKGKSKKAPEVRKQVAQQASSASTRAVAKNLANSVPLPPRFSSLYVRLMTS